MKFTFAHNNFNVIDLDKSLKFYEEALGLKEVRRKEAADGSFILVYLGDATTGYQLELTWLKDRDKPYDLGECEFHLAFVTDQYDDFYAKHKEMGCVCFENPGISLLPLNPPKIILDRSYLLYAMGVLGKHYPDAALSFLKEYVKQA